MKTCNKERNYNLLEKYITDKFMMMTYNVIANLFLLFLVA